jgi:hypothetical protein
LTFASIYVLGLFPMSIPRPDSLARDDDAPDPDAARAAWRAKALEDLAEIGMAMAQALRDRMATAESDAAACEISLAFTRIARAVRLTVALDARLGEAQAMRAETLAAKAAEQRAAAAEAREARVELITGRVQDAVEMAIAAQTSGRRDGGYESERLSEALSEYLEDRRETETFADRPVSIVVAQVCQALGVRVDWDLWKNEDWAIEEWRARTPGSPYAQDAPAEAPSRGPPIRRLS